jgi:hypothetical protein
MSDNAGPERPPSRHQGSRLVTRPPSSVRTINTIRAEVRAMTSRVRPEEIAFADADPARGVPCTSATFAGTHLSHVYRSGRALFVDVLAYTGTGSVMEARLTAPDLSLTGTAVASPSGGTHRVVRVELALPETWLMGEAHLVYVEARRVSGSDATTVRVVRARQR